MLSKLFIFLFLTNVFAFDHNTQKNPEKSKEIFLIHKKFKPDVESQLRGIEFLELYFYNN